MKERKRKEREKRSENNRKVRKKGKAVERKNKDNGGRREEKRREQGKATQVICENLGKLFCFCSFLNHKMF